MRAHAASLAIIALIAAAVGLSPVFAVLLAVAGALLVATLVSLQLGALVIARRSVSRAPGQLRRELPCRPFVSIHMPCHNEPPDLVRESLEALSRLEWPQFEVICLDNNTSDPAVYEPVAEHCRTLGPRFRFYHFDDVRDAKAGALNIALELTDPRAQYIAVVDADYRVEPDFLHEAFAFLEDPRLSHAQFPQAYRNPCPGKAGMLGEYAHYFDTFMPIADRARATLLTGTMLVIRADILREVGGWRGDTITEDAELGARLAIHGHAGSYIPRVVGRGVMPTSFDALRAQRRRWVHGNATTLFTLSAYDWSRLTPNQRFGVLAQLTAWFNGLLLPAIVLTGLGMTTLLGFRLAGWHWHAAWIAALAALVQILGRSAVILLAPPTNAGLRWGALVAHFGLTWEGATGWLESAFRVQLQFVRTDKFSRTGSSSVGPALPAAFVLALAGVGLAGAHAMLAAIAALACAGVFALAVCLKHSIETATPDLSKAEYQRPR